MPADFSEYIDLTPFDVQPGDMYINAIEAARLSLPEFNLRVGTVEDAMFQAMAYLTAVNVASINRLPSRLMSGILGMMGVQRSEGVPAELTIIVTADSYDGAIIPAGTLFSFEAVFEDEIQEYVFESTEAIEILESESPAPGDPFPSTGVPTQCITPGFIAIVSQGQEFNILSSGIPALSAVADSDFSNGINPDTDSDYLARAVSFLSSLSQANNKAPQVESYISSNYPAVVSRVKVSDLTYGDADLGDISTYRFATPTYSYSSSVDATLEFASPHQFNVGEKVVVDGVAERFDTNTGLEILSTTESSITYAKGGSVTSSVSVSSSAALATVGNDIPGYVTIFVYGFNEFVSTPDKQIIISDVADRSVAGLTFDIRNPDILSLSIEADVVLNSSYDQTPLQESVINAVANYLSPLVFPYTEDRVRQTSLVSIISQMPGVIYVKSLSISPSGDGWLPQLDSDLIFQNKGALPLIDTEDISISFTSISV